MGVLADMGLEENHAYSISVAVLPPFSSCFTSGKGWYSGSVQRSFDWKVLAWVLFLICHVESWYPTYCGISWGHRFSCHHTMLLTCFSSC